MKLDFHCNGPKLPHIANKGCTGGSSFENEMALQQKRKYKVLIANDDTFQLMILMRVMRQFNEHFDIID